MSRSILSTARVLALCAACAFAAVPLTIAEPVWAAEGKGKGRDDEPRESKGKGKGGSDGPRESRGKGQDWKADRGPDKGDRRDGRGPDADRGGRPERDRDVVRRAEPIRIEPGRRVFEDRHRVVLHEYFVTEYRAGRCPPGLAKKMNGCMPPGLAKKWRVGHPLPREVIFYDLPPAIIVQIGAPPPGYRYVRVAADILLIAIGTGMVIDAITDLGRL